MEITDFPAMNACLNSLCTALLLLGFYFIRKREIKAHSICMIGACIVSALFLAGYLYYHYHHGSTKFQGEGTVRIIYFAILISHTILAMINAPMVIVTLVRGVKGDFEKHAKIARITFPIWLYVSVTGVVVYWMLYQMKW